MSARRDIPCDQQLLQPAEREYRRILKLLIRHQPQFWQALGEALQRNLRFQPCERRADDSG